MICYLMDGSPVLLVLAGDPKHTELLDLFNFSAKNELDMDEFMFFLTGGVGLENKVNALITLRKYCRTLFAFATDCENV